jgi:hypothetical protein
LARSVLDSLLSFNSLSISIISVIFYFRKSNDNTDTCKHSLYVLINIIIETLFNYKYLHA